MKFKETEKSIINGIYLLIGLLIFFTFKFTIECFIQDFFLDPINRFLYPINLFFLSLLFILIYLVFLWKEIRPKFINNYQFDENEILFYLTLSCVWCYRFQGNFQDYYFIPINEKIPVLYFDFLLLFLLPYSVLWIKLKIIEIRILKNRKERKYQPSVLREDKALSFYEAKNEEYGREKILDTLVSELNSFQNINSFAIAITGPWGIGKTSFLNSIEKKLSTENFININFQPWYNITSKNILSDFFITVDSQLNKHINLSGDFLNYGEKISNISDHYLSKMFNELISFIKNDKPASDKYNKLNNKLNKIHKKVIVYIDDLDRLDKKEIIEVLRLIRNAAAFDKFIFIVAFDKGYVLNAVKEFNDFNYQFYLEKIFSFEIPLIHPEKFTYFNHLINDFRGLSKEQENKLSKENLDSIEKFITSNKDFLYNYLKTNRDKNRFINTFIFNYRLVCEEVEIEDFFLIELLKLKYSEIHKLIYLQKDDFLIIDKNNLRGDLNEDLGLKGKGENLIISTHLESFFNNYSIDKNEIIQVQKLLDFIFCGLYINKSRPRTIKKNSVTKEPRFIFYFLYDSLEQFSIADLKTFMESLHNSNYEKITMQIIKWIDEGKFKDMYDKFSTLPISDVNLFKKFYTSIYLVCQVESIRYEFRYTLISLFNLKVLGTWKLNLEFFTTKQDYKNFLIDIFEKQTKPPFSVGSFLIFEQLRNILRDEIDEDSFILSKSELLNIQINYLQKVLNEIPPVNESIFQLYHRCMESIENNHIILNTTAREKFIKYITERPIEYLNHVIVNSEENFAEPSVKTMRAFVDQTFEKYQNKENGYDGFETFLIENENKYPNEPIVKKVRIFFIEFRKNGYRPIVFME